MTLERWHIFEGDCRAQLRALRPRCVQTCVTSPPYFGLRDYGHDGQIGHELTPEQYVADLVDVFRAVRDVLKDDGTLWLNLGDSYAAQGGAHGGRLDNQRGVGAARTHLAGAGDQGARRPPPGAKAKDLLGIPWMTAFALRADGWYLRSDIIWSKPNPMPESVKDRPTRAHEYLFLLTKRPRYYYDADAVAEPAKDWSTGGPGVGIKDTSERYGVGNGGNGGLAKLAARYRVGQVQPVRNRRSVWSITVKPFKDAHFATFPPELVEPCVLAGSAPDQIVLDPFVGSGTTGEVAHQHGRRFIGIELNPAYAEMARVRLSAVRTRTLLGLEAHGRRPHPHR